jgi:hypothetical protein
MRSYYGYIYPSAAITPNRSCHGVDNINLFLDGNTITLTEFPIAIVSIDNDPIVVLDRSDNGAIVLKRIFLNDVNDDNLVDINSNHFFE